MKKIDAIIQTFKLNEVKKALNDMGIQEIVTSRVSGYGRQKGHEEIIRGSKYLVDFTPKVRIEFMVDFNQVNLAMEKIRNSAHTGKIGDGKIFVSSVADTVYETR